MPHFDEAPAPLQTQVREKKRRREDGAEWARKFRKTATGSCKSKEDVHSDILLLENGILESRKNYNSIITLLEYMRAEPASDERDVVAAVALYRVFCRLMVLGNLTKNGDASGAETTIVQWLKERLRDFEEALLRIIQSADPTKQTTALTLLMRLVKEKAVHLVLSEDVTWRNGLFRNTVQGLITTTDSIPAVDEFVEKYVKEFVDIRYYTFTCLA